MRYLFVSVAVLAAAIMMLAAGPAHAGPNTVTVQPPVQSATFRWTCMPCPGENDGRLYVGVDFDETYRGALKFDLGAIPSRSLALDAKLRVYHDGKCFKGIWPATILSSSYCSPSHAVEVVEITSPWTQASTAETVTTASSELDTFAIGGSTAKWLVFDVTDLVNDWLSGFAANHGMILRRSSEPFQSGGIAPFSATYPDPGLRPKLEVTYVLPGTYAHAQEADAGLPPTPGPLEWSLPQCADDGGWDGYGSEEELALAIDQAPSEPGCADDPAGTVTYVGMAMPGIPDPQRPGYFFNGPETRTSRWYEGGMAEIEVINPDVTHPPPAGQPPQDFEFVSGHVLASEREDRYRFIQIGWTERSDAFWGDRRFIYWYDRRRNRPTQTRYRVGDNKFVGVRVRSIANGLARTEIFWNGGWRPVATSLNTRCINVGPSCNIEVFLEVHSKDGSLPTLFATATTFRKLKLRTAPNTWELWDSTFPTLEREASPYAVCYEHRFYRFHVGKDLLC